MYFTFVKFKEAVFLTLTHDNLSTIVKSPNCFLSFFPKAYKSPAVDKTKNELSPVLPVFTPPVIAIIFGVIPVGNTISVA